MNNKKIGKFVRKLREEKELSQNQLAEKIFVSRTLVSKWESGKITITSQNLKILSEFFDISLDEIIFGERKTKFNKELIENASYIIYDDNVKLKKIIKIVALFCMIFLISFLLYFFFTFYNSVNIYILNTDSNFVRINNGLLIKTNDKIYLRFEPQFLEEEKVESIVLYYILDNKKEICRSTNVGVIAINDFYDTQEYFGFSNFNNIKDNLYLEINYKDNTVELMKLNFKRDYTNSKIFFKYDDNEFEDNKLEKNNDYNSIFELCSEQTIEINQNEQKYQLIIFDNTIIINNKEVTITYNNLIGSTLQKMNNDEEVYLYNITNQMCISGDCNNFERDYQIFKQLINELLNNHIDLCKNGT